VSARSWRGQGSVSDARTHGDPKKLEAGLRKIREKIYKDVTGCIMVAARRVPLRKEIASAVVLEI
jgi:hypothetical protein